MSDGASFALVVLGPWLAGSVLLTVVVLRSAHQWTAWGISHRLRCGHGPLQRRITYTVGAWNPAKPLGRGNRTRNEPGWATYQLTAEGLVRVDVTYDDGRTETHIGPAVEPPAGARRAARIGLIGLFAYPVGSAAGTAVGFAVARDAHANRWDDAAVGLVIGLVLTWLVLTIISTTVGMRAGSGVKESSPPEMDRG